ncbi:hypothetical protein M231_03457 [Tremella mesenterica]|uniref:Uncharacterized protein n=1 Tax=Tremella mesenterica TaxID=5217 RepID=A0A4V1M460_TREME|nr:hypothetical protein M231_03457 [Tremella mesenterica]
MSDSAPGPRFVPPAFAQRENNSKRHRGLAPKHPAVNSLPSLVNSKFAPSSTPYSTTPEGFGNNPYTTHTAETNKTRYAQNQPMTTDIVLEEFNNDLRRFQVMRTGKFRDKLNSIARDSANRPNRDDFSKRAALARLRQMSGTSASLTRHASQSLVSSQDTSEPFSKTVSQSMAEQGWEPLNSSLVQETGFIEEIPDNGEVHGPHCTNIDFSPEWVDIFNYRIDEMPYGTEATAILPAGDQTFYDSLVCSNIAYEMQGGSVVRHPCQLPFGRDETVLVSLV